jgi:hypothetical protein
VSQGHRKKGGIKVENPIGRPRGINQRISNARVKEALI